jgi:hypothetical protein
MNKMGRVILKYTCEEHKTMFVSTKSTEINIAAKCIQCGKQATVKHVIGIADVKPVEDDHSDLAQYTAKDRSRGNAKM